MQLTPWSAFGDFDRFLEEFPSSQRTFSDLAVDLYEKDGSIIAEMSMPGIDAEKLDVSVEDHFLRVSGSSEETKEEKNKQYYRKEIRRGTFERAVRLPAPVEREKVTATYKDGLLIVTLPKLSKDSGNAHKVKVER